MEVLFFFNRAYNSKYGKNCGKNVLSESTGAFTSGFLRTIIFVAFDGTTKYFVPQSYVLIFCY